MPIRIIIIAKTRIRAKAIAKAKDKARISFAINCKLYALPFPAYHGTFAIVRTWPLLERLLGHLLGHYLSANINPHH